MKARPLVFDPAHYPEDAATLAAQNTVVGTKAADIPSSIPRCIAPDSPVTDAALALYFSLDAVHRNLPDRTQAYAKQVGATLNSAHMVLWGNGRDA